MKGFVTKYALTTGITEVTDNFYENGDDYLNDRTNRFMQSYSKSAKQWHETREEAIEQAYKMKFAKIASLERQIKKLKTIEFMC